MTNRKVAVAGPPIHPGEVLADELAEIGATASDAARAMGVPVNRISEILRCRRGMTADTALRLGQWLGTDPNLWLDLQNDYDMRLAARSLGPTLKKIRRAKAAPRADKQVVIA